MTERFFASVRFEVPGPPPAEVGRQRLVDALIASPAPTTIVTGSPGAGKTAVLTAWVAQRSDPTVWLSCDPSDADPVRFWAALAHAVQRVLPDAGADPLVRLDGAARESPDTAASLAGDCAGVPGLAIVLDDFHHAGAAPGVFSTFVQALPGRRASSWRHVRIRPSRSAASACRAGCSSCAMQTSASTSTRPASCCRTSASTSTPPTWPGCARSPRDGPPACSWRRCRWPPARTSRR